MKTTHKFLLLATFLLMPFIFFGISVWVATPEQLPIAGKYALTGLLIMLFLMIAALLYVTIDDDDE